MDDKNCRRLRSVVFGWRQIFNCCSKGINLFTFIGMIPLMIFKANSQKIVICSLSQCCITREMTFRFLFFFASASVYATFARPFVRKFPLQLMMEYRRQSVEEQQYFSKNVRRYCFRIEINEWLSEWPRGCPLISFSNKIQLFQLST